MIEAQVHCGLESPGVGVGLHGRREVVPLDGHQRDEAADPVRGRGGVEARQDKEAGVGACVGSCRGRAWRAEGPQGLWQSRLVGYRSNPNNTLMDTAARLSVTHAADTVVDMMQGND